MFFLFVFFPSQSEEDALQQAIQASLAESYSVGHAKYRLKCVVLHDGEYDCGHYFTHVVGTNNQILEYNDSIVSPVSTPQRLQGD